MKNIGPCSRDMSALPEHLGGASLVHGLALLLDGVEHLGALNALVPRALNHPPRLPALVCYHACYLERNIIFNII